MIEFKTMIDFCEAAPDNLFKTCLMVYEESWWSGFNYGACTGIVLIVVMGILLRGWGKTKL